jgi:hypothetical protein
MSPGLIPLPSSCVTGMSIARFGRLPVRLYAALVTPGAHVRAGLRAGWDRGTHIGPALPWERSTATVRLVASRKLHNLGSARLNAGVHRRRAARSSRKLPERTTTPALDRLADHVKRSRPANEC